MLDPISLAAVTAVLGAVGAGMANEVGKRGLETAGGLVRRIAGREVVAPADPDQTAAVARIVYDGVHRDPALARAWHVFARSVPLSGAGAATGATTARPELPPSVRFFTDRDDAMKILDREASRAADGRPRIALLHGAPGMGTSALAVHWGARRAAKWFPDGQIHVDLRGFSAGTALDGSTALRAVLRQLGVPEEEVPPTADDRVGLLRALVAERRLLMVLDHAYSAAQVRPLITSAPGVFVLAVAANVLPGLDAVRVPVGPLAKRDAMRLLTEITGKQVVSRARATLPAVLDRCGGSPFALRAAALRLAEEAAPAPRPADAATEADPVRAAAEDAYRLLEPATARLYRLISLHPWPAIGPAAASWIGQTDTTEAARLLDELVAVHLIELDHGGRHFYRPGVRAHAEDTAHREDRAAGCAAAVTRAVAGHLDLALRAANAALPESWRVPAPPDDATHAHPMSRAEAMDVLVAERGNLVQAVHAAEEFGDFTTVVRLGQALWPLQLKAGHHEELLPALRLAAGTADAHFPDSRAAGSLQVQLAHTLTELARHEEAETAALAAAANERAAGHARGHASAVELLGLLRLRQWRYDEAYACFDEAGRIYDTIGPGGEGEADLPRARALLERHRGRALRGLGDRDGARSHLTVALRFFRDTREAYNTARTLTDLAETSLDGGDPAGALPLIDEAVTALAAERASYHLAHLRALRQSCLDQSTD